MNKENITAEPDRSITDRPSVVRETQIMLTRLSLDKAVKQFLQSHEIPCTEATEG